MSVRAVGGAVAVLACLAPVPVAAAPRAAGPLCTTVTASPEYARDRMLWCAGQERDQTGHPRAVRVHRSADGGRTWRAVGVIAPASPNAPQSLLVAIVASPRFAADRRLVVQTTRELHVSTDLGATFQLLDGSGGGQYADSLAPVVSDPAGGRALLLNATPVYNENGASATDVDTGAHVVGAAPGAVLRFLPVTPAGPVHAVVRDRAGDLAVWACAAPPVCATRLAAFPSGATYVGGAPVGDGSAFVAVRARDGAIGVWRGNGTAYARWPEVERLVRPVAPLPGAFPELRVVAAPDQARTLYALVAHRSAARAVAAHRVFRSVDGGRSWGLVAAGRSRRQGGATALPWNAAARAATGGGWQLVALPGRRLVVVAATESAPGRFGYEGPFCSRDGGRRWARSC